MTHNDRLGPAGGNRLLYHWMMENYDLLVGTFARYGPQWAHRLQAFADMGLTDRSGRPPTQRTAQATWYRVRRVKLEEQRAKASAPPPAFQPDENGQAEVVIKRPTRAKGV